MTPRIEALKQYFVLDKAHHAVRVPALGAEGAPYRDAALPAHRRSALRLKAALEAETPVIFPEERIVATRTRPALPGIFTEEEWRRIEEPAISSMSAATFPISQPDYRARSCRKG